MIYLIIILCLCSVHCHTKHGATVCTMICLNADSLAISLVLVLTILLFIIILRKYHSCIYPFMDFLNSFSGKNKIIPVLVLQCELLNCRTQKQGMSDIQPQNSNLMQEYTRIDTLMAITLINFSKLYIHLKSSHNHFYCSIFLKDIAASKIIVQI